MASTPSSIGNVEQIGVGDALNTWGFSLNACIDRLTEMGVGVTSISLTGNKTLTTTNYVANESRWGGIRFTDGGLSSAPTVTFPAETRSWLVINTGSTYAVNCLAAGSGVGAVSVAAGKWAIIDCDGTDMFIRDLSNMGGDLALASIADIASGNVLGNMSGSTASPSLITVYDEDNMASNSATGLATQQSIKAYVDTSIGSGDVAVVAANIADVQAVAAIDSDVSIVAADGADIGTVAVNIAAVNNVSTNMADVQNASSLVSGLSAGDIANVAAGNIAATDVQAALNELDGEKVSGPASATDNALVQFDGTTGKLAKNGPSIGTSANNLVQLDGSARLPAVDGSQLTNLDTGGLTQISQTVVGSAVASVEFTSIPSTYDHLYIQFDQVTTDNVSGVFLNVNISNDNGTTYTANQNDSSNFVSGATPLDGGSVFFGYNYDSGACIHSIRQMPGTLRTQVGAKETYIWRAEGGIDAIRIRFDSDNIDGGTITLYGY